MKILGIDPGTRITAYSIVEAKNKNYNLLEYGKIVPPPKEKDHSIKLGYIYNNLQQVIIKHSPDCVSIEAAFYGKNVQSLIKLGRVQGIILALAMQYNLPYKMFAPREIKKSITGYGNASKEQVALMLQHFLKQKIDFDTYDISDAIAIALTYSINNS